MLSGIEADFSFLEMFSKQSCDSEIPKHEEMIKVNGRKLSPLSVDTALSSSEKMLTIMVC